MKHLIPCARLRGSALLSVVVFTTVALLIIGSLLSWSLTERRLNYRNALRLEARNAAEALAEYGFSQIRHKLESRSTVSLDPDGSDALSLPPGSFWNGSNVQASANELIGGTVELVPASGSSYYFNPADPNNAFDPLNGKHVFRRDVRVIAKATVRPPSIHGGEITAHVSQRISVRGAPLFAHAIFYNMDLEIFNGPNMTISGPVHTNGNLYLYPGNGATLTFTDQVTATGGIYHAKKPGDTSSDGNSAEGRTGDIKFPNKHGQSVSLKEGSTWKDTTQGAGTAADLWSDFRNYASQQWHGNLQTAAHGVDNYTPVAIGQYSEDPDPGVGADTSDNSGRGIIEPSNYPLPTDPDYATKMEVEQQKYANDAGLYITVNPATQAISLSSRGKSDPTKNKTLTLPSSGKLVTYKPYTATTVSQTAGNKINSGANKNKYPITTKTETTTVNGTTSTEVVTYSNNNDTVATTKTVNSGMYDQQRKKGTDLIELDIDALRLAVASMAGQANATTTAGTQPVTAADQIGQLTGQDWTGIVYVEVVGGPTTDPLTGATNPPSIPASLQTSVRLVNGEGKVPSYGSTTEGLTIATNAPVYIKGNYNADGTTSTSNPNSATAPEVGEVPAAIVGDAVTILSKNFNDATSLSTVKQNNATSTIEIAAALLVGLTPTNKDGTGKSSGGAHNLPRFLEDWTNKSTFIRGSLVSLFENRVFTEPHGGAYYSPPVRNWGFNSMFRDGRYPPGTPRVMSYRRVDFTDLNASEYDAAKASFNW